MSPKVKNSGLPDHKNINLKKIVSSDHTGEESQDLSQPFFLSLDSNHALEHKTFKPKIICHDHTAFSGKPYVPRPGNMIGSQLSLSYEALSGEKTTASSESPFNEKF
jgi:hypothetical protein